MSRHRDFIRRENVARSCRTPEVRRSTEVFSTDWSFGAGQDERCFGDGADPLRAQSNAVERLPAGLEQRDPAFSLSAQTADELVAGEVV
jgi:hypothetical protein